MLALLAASALIAHDNLRVELRRADALYAQLDPYPTKPPGNHLRDTLDAFRDIVADHGPIPTAEAGIGKCLFLFGRFHEAAKAFRLAGVRYRARRQEASEYAGVSLAIDRQSKPLTVQQLRHVPGTNRWVALLDLPPAESGWEEGDDRNQLAVFRRVQGTNRFVHVGKPEKLGQFWAGYFSTLYLTHLSQHDSKWRLLFFRQGSADCSPYDVRILSVVPSGLKTIKSFEIYQGAWVRGPSANHGLLVMLGPVWHLDWADLYEWTGGSFKFANRRLPRYFKVDNDALSNYADWMTRAAELDIHGRFPEAKIAWRRARWACRMAIRHESYGAGDPFHASEQYGDARVNLKEIVRRLGWLARREYNHALLYRPIDRALQVPPYKLGHARD